MCSLRTSALCHQCWALCSQSWVLGRPLSGARGVEGAIPGAVRGRTQDPSPVWGDGLEVLIYQLRDGLSRCLVRLRVLA